MPTFTGKCLCGAIEFQAEADKAAGAVCHCRNCQITTSGASYNLGPVPADKRSVTKGSPKEFMDKGTKSGKPMARCFCGDCGTPIWSVTADGGAWVKVGAFVNAGEFEPVCEIFTDHALPGLKVSEKKDGVLCLTSEQM